MFIDFEYANKRLSDFGWVLCDFDSNKGVQEAEIGCNITFNTVKNNHSSIHSITSSTYENVYTKPFKIMKNPCIYHDDNIYATTQEIRALTKWLNRRVYHKFKPDKGEQESSDICYYGSFNIMEIVLYDKVVGLSLTFTSNAPYGFSDMNELSFSISEKNEKIFISGDSDEYGVIYPYVKITCNSNGTLQIKNLTTSNKVEIKNCSNNETIYMDGEHKIIYSDIREQSEICGDFNYEYLDIEIDDNDNCENEYEISIPCEITINYSPIRKVGVV